MEQPQNQNVTRIVYIKQDNNNLATVGFIFAFIMPFVGLCLSIAGCSRASKKECFGKGRTLSILGIVFSIIMLILEIIVIILYLSLLTQDPNPNAVLNNFFIRV